MKFAISSFFVLFFAPTVIVSAQPLKVEIGFVAEQNQRETMEDVVYTRSDVLTQIIGIFDGHGQHGSLAANLAASTLAGFEANFPLEKVEKDLKTQEPKRMTIMNDHKDILTECFEGMEKKIQSISNLRFGGTTALVAYISPMPKFAGTHCHIGWIGDSRAILVDTKNKKVVFSTKDHKPHGDNEQENERLKPFEQYITAPNNIPSSIYRLNGLAMSRSVGDKVWKEDLRKKANADGIIAIPEIVENIPVEDGYILVAASDGLWDDISNDEAAQICSENSKRRASAIAYALRQKAIEKGSTDNIAIAIAKFSNSNSEKNLSNNNNTPLEFHKRKRENVVGQNKADPKNYYKKLVIDEGEDEEEQEQRSKKSRLAEKDTIEGQDT